MLQGSFANNNNSNNNNNNNNNIMYYLEIVELHAMWLILTKECMMLRPSRKGLQLEADSTSRLSILERRRA
jgi:hypothetical protein